MSEAYGETYTQGGDTHQVNLVAAPPSLPCPTCAAPVTVVEDVCVICGRCFTGGELWEIYTGVREATREHYR